MRKAAFLLAGFIFLAAHAYGLGEKFDSFQTSYCTVYYRGGDLERFLGRIGGGKIDARAYPGLAKNRLDRIVEKVQAVLDMYPRGFRVKIYVLPEYKKGPIAFYTHNARSITTFADSVTAGHLAREISNAVILAYFKTPPPEKVREILSGYVDRHVWGD